MSRETTRCTAGRTTCAGSLLCETASGIVHPSIGLIELDCQTLVAENQAQALLVYTATPGTEDYEKLRLLAVIGAQQFHADLTEDRRRLVNHAGGSAAEHGV